MRPTTKSRLMLVLAGVLSTSVARADLPPESLGGTGGTFDLGTGGYSGTYTTYGGSAGTYDDPYAGYAGYGGTFATTGGNAGTYAGPGTGAGGTVVIACPPGTAGSSASGGTNSSIAGTSNGGTTGAGTTGAGNTAGADLGTGNATPGVCGQVVTDDQSGSDCAVSMPGQRSGRQGRVAGVMLLLGLGALWLERRRR